MLKVYLPKFCQLLEEHLGIKLDESRQYLIESRLLPLVESSGFENVLSLIKYLTQNNVGPLHWQVFELLTTNETSFFRDKHVFDEIRTTLLPDIIEKNATIKSIKIWNAAVSSGQEAYSIAMLIREYFPQLKDWDISIHGSDISKKMIEKARSGIYTAHEMGRGIDEKLKQRYFSEQLNGSFIIDESIKKLAHFSLLNLISDWADATQYDLVMLRNVLIYFNEVTQKSVLEKVSRCIHPEHGALLLGASELMQIPSHLKRLSLGNTFYYRHS